jgi:hypothetical protein
MVRKKSEKEVFILRCMRTDDDDDCAWTVQIFEIFPTALFQISNLFQISKDRFTFDSPVFDEKNNHSLSNIN